MGKKSKRSKPKTGQKGGGAARASADAAANSPTPERAEETQAHQPQPPPPDASCWICLDGDPDEAGNPIVRDCSCRGDDAGFAHISCLANYARGKTLEMMDAPTQSDQNYNEPWTTCPNCRRNYQRRVAIDMANALLSFMDEKYPGDELTKVHALHRIVISSMSVDYIRSPELRAEGRRAAHKIDSIVQESGNCEVTYLEYQLDAHVAVAKCAEAEKTKDGYETALDYYTKALILAQSNDLHAGTTFVTELESNIGKVKSLRDGGKEQPFTDEELQMIRAHYERSVEEEGEDHSNTIYMGICLLQGLYNSGEHGLECERLAPKLTAISRRVNGPDHHLTKHAEEGAKLSSLRRIAKVRGSTVVMHEVLRISDDERMYVLKKTSAPDEGKITEVAFDDEAYMMVTGTPVVCEGLIRAAHLNGKLGDVRSFNKDTGRYAVRFEDRSLGTVSVRLVNLRIAFELPEER